MNDSQQKGKIMDKPSWYWSKGLHDAKIITCKIDHFNYDYTQKNPIRNCISIDLDAHNALFDTTIATIKFLNAKIIQGDIDCEGWFWKDDELTTTCRGYALEIALSSYPKTKKIKIFFDDIIVERQ